jgi:hypothetical protein
VYYSTAPRMWTYLATSETQRHFLWGFWKEKLLVRKLAVLGELRALVILLCRTISVDVCHKVITNG